jgi:hypothetical protein
VTWNSAKGEVKDARVALPALSLAARLHPEFMENALANMVGLDLRLFVRSLNYAHSLKAPRRVLRRLVERRLRDLEADPKRWNHAAVQHKDSLHYLYRRYFVAAPEFVSRNVFGDLKSGERLEPLPGTVFHAIQQLPKVTPVEAAGLILKFNLPFLVVRGALGEKATNPDVSFAIIQAMSPTELIANTKDLKKNYLVDKHPHLRAAFEKKLEEAQVSKKGPTMKASRAAEALDEVDQLLASKMRDLQEKKMETISVDGNWLVLGDKSGSMRESIEKATEIAATLARSVKGDIHLIFFDNIPRYLNATGKSLEEIKHAIRHMVADGGTSIGCGVRYALEQKLDIDGIAIVSDGAEHHSPFFRDAYKAYSMKFGKEVPVYFYAVPGEPNTFSRECAGAGIDVQTFDFTQGKVDYYSLPNIVRTMRTSRYSLVEEIMRMPLLTLDEVLPRTKGSEVIGRVGAATSV